jgi:hypothetical protein
MNVNRSAVAAAVAAIAVSGWVILGPERQIEAQILTGALGVSGEAVYPSFEGWGPLKDGTNAVLIGYYNRNKEQELDIPIGPNNHIEPGGPDYGQPTHFFTGRAWGVFAIPLPKDFGTKRLTWTLTANGHTTEVQYWMNPPYWVGFYEHPASGNQPPVIRYTMDGKEITGPPVMKFDQSYDVGVNQPLKLTLYVRDDPPTYDPNKDLDAQVIFNPDTPGNVGARPPLSAGGTLPEPPPTPPAAADQADGRGRGRGGRGGAAGGRGGAGGRGRGGPRPDITVKWEKYRGPGWVSIDDETLEFFKKREGETVVDEHQVFEATTQAWFDTPGEYWLLGTINDQSGNGGGGDQCCWTSTHVRVTVK